MEIDEFRSYCLSFPYTTEHLPFGPDVLVFKVKNKMFALADLKSFESITLKCDPEKAIELRTKYPSVIPGYHMNKQHWNTIKMDGHFPESMLKGWIKDSYLLIVDSLKKRDQEDVREALETQENK